MALRWLGLDQAIVTTMGSLAGSSWDPNELDSAWRRAGLPIPEGGVSTLVFGPYARYGAMLDAGGEYDIEVCQHPEGRVDSFFVKFAVFGSDEDCDGYDPEHYRVLGRYAEPADASEQFHTFRSWGAPSPGGEPWFQPALVKVPTGQPGTSAVPHVRANRNRWRGDHRAGYRDFNAVWRHAQVEVENLLGPADAVGAHRALRERAPIWHHAAWRLGGCLLAVLQADDDIDSPREAAYLGLKRFPPDVPIPDGYGFYSTMLDHSLAAPRTADALPQKAADGRDLWSTIRQVWRDRLAPVDPALIGPAMPESARSFLTSVGLPTKLSSDFNFHFLHDRQLLDTITRDGRDYLPVAMDAGVVPVAVEIRTGQVYDILPAATGREPRLTNSSVDLLVAFVGLIDMVEATSLGSDASSYERDLRQLEKQLIRMDPPAMAASASSWPDWLRDIKSH